MSMGLVVRATAAGVVAGCLLAGCSTQGTTAPGSSGAPAPAPSAPAGAPSTGASTGVSTAVPNDPVVRWVDGFCAPIGDLVRSAGTQPTIDTSNPSAMRTSLAAFFGSIADQLGRTATALRALGPAPVPGGDRAATSLATAYEQTRAVFLQTKQQLATTADPNALATALNDIGPKLQQLGATDPLRPLADNPRLTTAAKQAPHCQSLHP